MKTKPLPLLAPDSNTHTHSHTHTQTHTHTHQSNHCLFLEERAEISFHASTDLSIQGVIPRILPLTPQSLLSALTSLPPAARGYHRLPSSEGTVIYSVSPPVMDIDVVFRGFFFCCKQGYRNILVQLLLHACESLSEGWDGERDYMNLKWTFYGFSF